AAHRAIQTENRDTVHRIDEVRRLDHVVLLVAAQPVLRAERGGDLDVAARGKRVERVREILSHGRGVSEQREPASAQRGAQRAFRQQAIDTEAHDVPITSKGRQYARAAASARTRTDDESPAVRAGGRAPNTRARPPS